ncbi:MAG: nitronate monooxygenase [Bacteroidales bacterium]|jgi:nitronate monooxygenase|nr:nitronate monooxygenase [Bacteroidales bacterium]MDG2080706.1 nitronate monooxygenase [Bacteroidales bacterium]|tara:strand:- start:1801 stop:2739 length:939 start_codon:yes stop_codon:yes gene_type:complete
MKPSLSEMLGIEHSIIMAPMFLVTNVEMMICALDNGITAAIPALNFRTDVDMRKALNEIKSHTSKPFGVNLIVNKSNIKLKKQLQTCLDLEVAFIITSLGNPKEIINKCKPKGIKVFCDVVDLDYAKKVEASGADAVIAVNSQAGGHSGNLSPTELITMLNSKLNIPVISAGGISCKDDIDKALELGAQGVSVGTIFIASDEAGVSKEYKNALVDYSASDIIMTSHISGTPVTVINTPYVKSLKHKNGWITRKLTNNKRLKKIIKFIIMSKGMNSLKKAATKPTYKTVWVAGPSIQNITKINSVTDIIKSLI